MQFQDMWRRFIDAALQKCHETKNPGKPPEWIWEDPPIPILGSMPAVTYRTWGYSRRANLEGCYPCSSADWDSRGREDQGPDPPPGSLPRYLGQSRISLYIRAVYNFLNFRSLNFKGKPLKLYSRQVATYLLLWVLTTQVATTTTDVIWTDIVWTHLILDGQ